MTANPRFLRWLGVATIIFAAWVAYMPALRGGFLWDDHSEIVSNAEIKAADGLRKIWLGEGTLDYFPLKSTVQWLQWRLWGERTFGYHVTNLVLHIGSALLVWRLLAKLGLALGWVGGLLFAIHPLATESVAWIAELKNVLSLPPLLLAVICYIEFIERKRRGFYAASLALFLAAALCKSSVVMLPVVLLVYAWWRKQRVDRADVFSTIPYFAISVALGLVTIWFQQERAIAHWEIEMGSGFDLGARAIAAIAFYASKSVWPGTLLPVYPRGVVTSPLLQVVATLALIALIAWCWRSRESWGRHVLLGLGWFLLNLFPVLGLVKMAFLYFAWVSDHFAYIPLVGVAGLAAAGCDYIWRRRAAVRPLLIAAVTAVGILGTLQTRGHAAHFTSEANLWRYTLQHNPDVWLGHSNLAVSLLLERKFEQALEHASAAIRLKPDYASAHANVVNALANLGRADEALAAARRAEQFNASSPDLHASVAAVLLRRGRVGESIGHYQRAIKLKPSLPKPHKELGVAYYLAGRMDEAIVSYERGLAIEPDADTQANCGVALVSLGRLPEAIRHYEAALRIAPDHVDAHYNFGIALVHVGQPLAALRHFERVLQQNPNHAEAHYNRGEALLLLARRAEARNAFQTALRLRPTLTEARQQLQRLDSGRTQP